jgi:hypothetical protein
MQQDTQRNEGGAAPYPQESQYITPPAYSREQPHPRLQYIPSPPPIGQTYSPLPAFKAVAPRPRDYDDNYYSDASRSPRRPNAISRRSSSYHGPRNRDEYYDGVDDRRQQRHRRRGSSDMLEKAKDAERRHKLKDELGGIFTTSGAGLTGTAIGAVVGGWATQKAQVASGKGKNGASNTVLTLLGAAVGGLAVNAVVDKFEERKRETAVRQAKWDEKFEDSDEDSGDDKGGERRDRGYLGKRDGHGYQSYRDGYN